MNALTEAGYESWFVSARDPDSARALWIRHTQHRPLQGPGGRLLSVTTEDADPVPVPGIEPRPLPAG